MAGGLWSTSPCWRQVLLLPDSQGRCLGRTPGQTLSTTTDRRRFSGLQAHATSKCGSYPGTQVELTAEQTNQPGDARLPERVRGWLGQQGRRRLAVHPGEGIPSRSLVFVGRKFDPPGAVGWCLRPFLSGLKKEFSICQERLGLLPRGGIQSL